MSQEQQKTKKRKNALLVDSSRCVGCFSCEVACKLEHDLPAGPRMFKVIQMGPMENDSHLVMSFMAVTCLHCDRPACVSACPTGAMRKRADGIVFSDPELCIGCQTCAIACPFGVPQLNPGTGKIAKCDGCMVRVEQDLWPACVLKCPTGALAFGSTTRVVQEIRQQEAMKIARSLKLDT
ncbi:MAG: 4Fe-4S dicluster domain-containing protein [Deltaproteobacteria bacterium]|nr:4Fe-4S dicluster domain-containing protein [Deltaproteobacteria bacterium]